MTTQERIQSINQRSEENRIRRNSEIDKFKIAYKVKDTEGNVFVYGGIESGFPFFRGNRGSKHISNLKGYEIIQKYDN